MATATGVVKGVYNKDVKTKFGMKPVWDILLDDGNYYKNGFKKPICDVGDTVTIEYTPGKYGNEISLLVRGATSSGATPPLNGGDGSTKPNVSPYSSVKSSGFKPFPVPSDHGDRSIIRQNSLTNARELVVGIINSKLEHDTGTNNKPVRDWSDRQSQFEGLADEIIRIAYKFEEYSSGDREVKAVDSLMEANATSKVKKPKLKVVKAEVEDTDGE